MFRRFALPWRPRLPGPVRSARRILPLAAVLTAGALPAATGGASAHNATGLIRNGVIVFTRNFPDTPNAPEASHLYAIKPTGGRARPLITIPGADECCAAWSPDGSRLAFDRFGTNSPFTVVVSDRDGGNARQIAPGVGPVWSPSGREIAYESSPSSGESRIYLIRPDGTGKRRLSPLGLVSAISPAWSPDGSRLAFTAQRTYSSAEFIDVIGENGRNEHRLAIVAASASGPAWSSDGKLIAFATENDRYAKLLVASNDGKTRRTLLTRSVASLRAIGGIGWARDGRTIAFTAATGEANNAPLSVYVVGSTGDRFKRVKRLAFDPVWSPNGRELVFATFYRWSNKTALEIVNWRGNLLRWIDISTWNDQEPAWQPRR
jgi:Tol biopolymer transport system component